VPEEIEHIVQNLKLPITEIIISPNCPGYRITFTRPNDGRTVQELERIHLSFPIEKPWRKFGTGATTPGTFYLELERKLDA
jgi:hypothetical protein